MAFDTTAEVSAPAPRHFKGDIPHRCTDAARGACLRPVEATVLVLFLPVTAPFHPIVLVFSAWQADLPLRTRSG
jgi:hypothetical protein